MIHLYPQSLEEASRGVLGGIVRQNGLCGIKEVGGCGKRAVLTGTDNGGGQTTAVAQLPEETEDVGELLLVIGIEDVGRGELTTSVHPHIQG